MHPRSGRTGVTDSGYRKDRSHRLWLQEGPESPALAIAIEKADKISFEVMVAAIHRDKGAALIESTSERCLLRELELRSVSAITQRWVRVEHKSLLFDELLRFVLFVDDCLLVELKAVEISPGFRPFWHHVALAFSFGV